MHILIYFSLKDVLEYLAENLILLNLYHGYENTREVKKSCWRQESAKS